MTMDGEAHDINQWDLIIAHPPCTYLSAAGAVHLFNEYHQIKDKERYEKGLRAKRFFEEFLNAGCNRIAVENPVPLKTFHLPKYDQIIQQFMFGDPWQKRTCLWLKNLPHLTPTDICEPKGYWIGAGKAPNDMISGYRDQKTRSKTFPGIAEAMAAQWG